MNIGILGRGTVGNALGQALSVEHVANGVLNHNSVFYHDVDPAKSTISLEGLLFDGLDLIFVCLPTPQAKDSLRCDTSALDGFFTSEDLQTDVGRRNCFVIKSTVPVGYTKEASKQYVIPSLVHSPEFLTARMAVKDANNPTRNIIGWPMYAKWGRTEDGVDKCAQKLLDLYESRWPNISTYLMTSDESEAVKLFQNSFSAVKISFFNEIHHYATKMGMDWSRMLKALLAGGWINPNHTQVPGPDGKFGWGGDCIPKDLANLIDCMRLEDVVPDMTSAAIMRNSLDRRRIE